MGPVKMQIMGTHYVKGRNWGPGINVKYPWTVTVFYTALDNSLTLQIPS